MKAKITLFLIVLILIACLLRALALNWGLPFSYHNDETNYMEMALRIGIGKFVPEDLCHGTLFPDILFFVYALYFLAGKAIGLFASQDAFALSYLTDPSIFTILARLIVIGFSLGSFYLTYLIGEKLFNREVGLLASLFMGFSTTHYLMSIIGLGDMPAVFLLLLSFYLLLKYYFYSDSNIKGGLKYFYFSGFVLGLAMAAKLLAISGIGCLLVVWFLKKDNRSKLFSKKLFLGLFFILLGFFIAEPYPFLNPGKFLFSLGRIKGNYFDEVTTPVFTYFLVWLPNSLGRISAFTFFVAGFYFLFKRTKNAFLVLLIPFFHFLGLSMLRPIGFAYHLLPIIPFVCLLIAAFSYEASRRFKKWQGAVLFSLSLICIFNPVLDTFRYHLVITSKDTRTEAKEWIEKNIESGKGIILEGAAGGELVLVSKLNENLESLKDSRALVISRGGSGRFQKLLIENYDISKRTYRIYKVMQFREEDILNTQADFLVACGFFDLDFGDFEGHRSDQHYQQRKKVREAINRKFILIKNFEPYPKFRFYYPLLQAADYQALRRINILTERQRIAPGPEIGIYKRKDADLRF